MKITRTNLNDLNNPIIIHKEKNTGINIELKNGLIYHIIELIDGNGIRIMKQDPNNTPLMQICPLVSNAVEIR